MLMWAKSKGLPIDWTIVFLPGAVGAILLGAYMSCSLWIDWLFNTHGGR